MIREFPYDLNIDLKDDEWIDLYPYENIVKMLRMDSDESKGLTVESSYQVRLAICREAKSMAVRILELQKKSEHRESEEK